MYAAFFGVTKQVLQASPADDFRRAAGTGSEIRDTDVRKQCGLLRGGKQTAYAKRREPGRTGPGVRYSHKKLQGAGLPCHTLFLC